jgi:hypothetical protein
MDGHEIEAGLAVMARKSRRVASYLISHRRFLQQPPLRPALALSPLAYTAARGIEILASLTFLSLLFPSWLAVAPTLPVSEVPCVLPLGSSCPVNFSVNKVVFAPAVGLQGQNSLAASCLNQNPRPGPNRRRATPPKCISLLSKAHPKLSMSS